MPELNDALILFAIGLAAGAANIVAEAGSMIAMPALLLSGYTGAMANGTNRLVVFWLNLFALRTYYNRDRNEFRRSLRYAGFAVPGALMGSLVMLQTDDAIYRMIVGGIVLLGVWWIYLNKYDTPATAHHQKIPEWVANLLMFLIGFYGGYLQAGVGIFLSAAFSTLLGMQEIQKNVYKISILFAYLFPTSLIFIWTENVDWGGAVVLLAGYIAGSWVGSIGFFKHHPKTARTGVVLVVIILGLKLLHVM